MAVVISLLRGINVSGTKKIKMADLKVLYESLGYEQVNTLLQSGNVVFKTDQSNLEAIQETIYQAIQSHYGFESKIILRTTNELKAVVSKSPFTEEQLADPQKLLITFLSDEPDSEVLQTLYEAHTGPEIIQQQGRELYIFYPNGMGRSKLNNNFIERKLKIVATGRNWNTTTKLLTLAQGLS